MSSPPANSHLKFSLKQQNLTPIYIIEQNLKHNFATIQKFIEHQQGQNLSVVKSLELTKRDMTLLQDKIEQKLTLMQKAIINNMKAEIESNVSVILTRQLSHVLQKVAQSQSAQLRKEQEFERKIEQMQERLKYQIAQQNQKYFMRQISKIQKQTTAKIQSTINQKSALLNINKIPTIKNNKKPTLANQPSQKQKPKHPQPIQSSNHTNPQEHPQLTSYRQLVKNLQKKVEKLDEFRFQLEKSLTENSKELKNSWKQLGTQLLDNKKTVNKKIQELSLDLNKLKIAADFKATLEPTEEGFKKKITDKLTEFYKITSSLVTKSQFQLMVQRQKSITSQQAQSLTQIKQQLTKNNEYFTFYMNNSKSDDLNAAIIQLKQEIVKDKTFNHQLIQDIMSDIKQNKQSLEAIAGNIGELEASQETTTTKLQSVTGKLPEINQRIERLEDLNNLDHKKMNKIHSALDIELSFPSQDPSNHLQKLSHSNQLLTKQLELLKDQIFVLVSQKNMASIAEQDSILEMKAQLKKMKEKVDKIKVQSQELGLARKPWIIQGTNSQKDLQHRKKQSSLNHSSRKKISLDVVRAGGFLSNFNSEKNLNVFNSTPQQKFQIYQRYRQKYLSDTLKLPEIFKQKFMSEEFSKK